MLALTFDTETTGLADYHLPHDHPSQPHMCQLACRLLEVETKRLITNFNLLVKPDGWTMPPEVAAIHGWTQGLLERLGCKEVAVLNLFSRVVQMADVLVAHNAKFDIEILSIQLCRHNRQNILKSKPAFCTATKSTDLLKLPKKSGKPGYKYPNLQEAYRALVDPAGFEGAHDAMADVLACEKVYLALLDKGIT